ncbi:putative mediator of RNA polymerase II transcription subunit 26 [Papaver somniferum]|nr:putative mediator of RNA polymerase II transcription subunit 26 [Papaver somniferum]
MWRETTSTVPSSSIVSSASALLPKSKKLCTSSSLPKSSSTHPKTKKLSSANKSVASSSTLPVPRKPAATPSNLVRTSGYVRGGRQPPKQPNLTNQQETRTSASSSRNRSVASNTAVPVSSKPAHTPSNFSSASGCVRGERQPSKQPDLTSRQAAVKAKESLLLKVDLAEKNVVESFNAAKKKFEESLEEAKSGFSAIRNSIIRS